MTDRFLTERRQVMEIAKELERLWLVAVSSGNVSMRVGERRQNLMAITPTSRSSALKQTMIGWRLGKFLKHSPVARLF